MTIDARVRKMASSVARAGFSVISLGVNSKGHSLEDEELDGALLTRVTAPRDPRVSPRGLRLSRPEMLLSIRYRTEARKQRLHLARRHLTSEVAWSSEHPPRWASESGRAIGSLGRWMGLPDELAAKIGRRVTRYMRRLWKSFRFGPAKLVALYHQGMHQAMLLVSRVLARPSRPLLRKASWRRDLPELHLFEAAFGALVDDLEPDLIHAHDVFLLGVAARAASRARIAGRSTRLVYDAHEYVPGLPIDDRRRDALTGLEHEFYQRADAVVTVSEGLADLLYSRFGSRPALVMNTPDTERELKIRSVREVVGVGQDAPLVIYVGGVAPHRGAEILLEAMTMVDERAHLAFISNSTTGYVAGLLDMAERAGIGGRVHLAPYVVPDAVVSYISTASVSVIPLSRNYLNYEIALPNKLFQSVFARVPVVVSDNPEMQRFVTQHGVGEVFVGGDPHSLAEALSKVIKTAESYAEALDDPELFREIGWARQIEELLSTYDKLGVSIP